MAEGAESLAAVIGADAAGTDADERQILGGDMAVTLEQRRFTPAERAAIEKAGKNATREGVRNAIAGMSFEGVTGNFTLDKKGSPKKSVVVLELKDGKPQYKTTIQPAK